MTEQYKIGSELSEKQIQVLPTFAAAISIDGACKEVGIGRDTFYRWLKNPVFKSELELMRKELVEEAIGQLKALGSKAVLTLASLSLRKDSPSVQRAAANDILNHLSRFIEMEELECRVKLLEGRMNELR